MFHNYYRVVHPGGVALRSSNLLRKNLILFLFACTVSHRALSNRSRERRDNVAHAWNISERFYCDRVLLPDWYAHVSVPKKFCRRVVCLTATLSRTRSLRPPTSSLPRSPLASASAACRALLRCCLRESRWRSLPPALVPPVLTLAHGTSGPYARLKKRLSKCSRVYLYVTTLNI